jgi:preprotein translocase subunit SecG
MRLMWKDPMQTVVIVIHLMIVVALIGVVLLQRSEGGGLGIGGGGGFMSSRGTANLLTRTTGILAAGFFVTSLFLSWLASYDRKPASLINPNPAPISRPGAPPVPTDAGGVLDQLQKQDQAQPPAAPAAPQAPRSQ